jgi:hypothetical protein
MPHPHRVANALQALANSREPSYSSVPRPDNLGYEIPLASRVDHVIHNHDGTIREKNSYGGDPYPPRG